MGIIYCITNNINGKVYIGKTINTFAERYPNGKWWHYTTNKHLKRAVKEYGKDSFNVKEIFNTEDSDVLSKKELEFIETYDATNRERGYNVVDSEIDYVKISDFKKSKPEEQKAIEYSVKSQAQKEAWAMKTREEMGEINKQRSLTLLSKSREIDFTSRVNKRQSRTGEEKELSEVKRILDRYGPSWQPGTRSVWFNHMDRFRELAATFGVIMNIKPTIYIVAGQCGVGKSWVCSQLTDQYFYVSSDKHKRDAYDIISTADRPVLFDPTVRSKTHASSLRNLGYNVIYVVIWEDVDTVKYRLMARGSKRLKNVEKMNEKYRKYSKAANFTGTSAECLEYLRLLH